MAKKIIDIPNKNNIIWGGDFNFEEHDKTESNKRFNEIKDILNLETTKDILSRSPKFTFRHRNYKRLDRFFTVQNLKAKQVEHIETRQYSDHLAVTIEVYKEGETEIKRGPGC